MLKSQKPQQLQTALLPSNTAAHPRASRTGCDVASLEKGTRQHCTEKTADDMENRDSPLSLSSHQDPTFNNLQFT
jgi:hypothetical protein